MSVFKSAGAVGGVVFFVTSEDKSAAANELALDTVLPPIAIGVQGGKLLASGTQALSTLAK